jgi:hypothetical protein
MVERGGAQRDDHLARGRLRRRYVCHCQLIGRDELNSTHDWNLTPVTSGSKDWGRSAKASH